MVKRNPNPRWRPKVGDTVFITSREDVPYAKVEKKIKINFSSSRYKYLYKVSWDNQGPHEMDVFTIEELLRPS